MRRAFGRYDKGDDRIEGYFPAVVTEDVYWPARAAAASRMVGTVKAAAQLVDEPDWSDNLLRLNTWPDARREGLV